MSGEQVTVLDSQTGRRLLSPNNQSLHGGTSLVPAVSLTPRTDGFDVRLAYHNDAPFPVELGVFTLSGIRLGPAITYREPVAQAPAHTLARGPGPTTGPTYTYTNNAYSPVIVLGDDTVTMGVSMLYPVLADRYTVSMTISSPIVPHAVDGRSWQLDVVLHGLVPSHGSREYTVAVRFVDSPRDWVRTLFPYRDYFQSLYPELGYSRDPRPVIALELAAAESLSPSNPYGFIDRVRRPDVHGWAPIAAWLRGWRSRNFQREMIWAPSGLCLQHRDDNFPFQFMSHMLDVPAMADTAQLRVIPTTGLQVGYWWGNSMRMMSVWDDAHPVTLDPNNPGHVARAYRELDGAVGLGATVIGLDTFGRIHPLDLYDWLLRLKARAPGVKFITEGATWDLSHRQAPAFTISDGANTEPVLADLCNPGHEFWCAILYNVLESRLGRTMSPAERINEVVRVAAMGYVPVVFDDMNLVGHNIEAAQTWLTTIPGGGGGTSGSGTTGGTGGAGGTGTTGGSGTTGGTGGTGGTGTTGGSGTTGGTGTGNTAQSGGGSSGTSGNGLGFLSPPGGARTGGMTAGGGSGGSGGGGGGGGGGSPGTSSFSGSSLEGGGGGGASVNTVHGGGGAGPQGLVTTVTNPKGARISAPSFTHEEIEAAIRRAKPKAFAPPSADKTGSASTPAKPSDSAGPH